MWNVKLNYTEIEFLLFFFYVECLFNEGKRRCETNVNKNHFMKETNRYVIF